MTPKQDFALFVIFCVTVMTFFFVIQINLTINKPKPVIVKINGCV